MPRRRASSRRTPKGADAAASSTTAAVLDHPSIATPLGSRCNKCNRALLRKMAVRTGVSFCFISSSLWSIDYFGHLAWCIWIISIQTFVFRELVNLRYKEARERDIPLFRTLQWMWYVGAMVWSYSRSWLRAPMGFFLFLEQFKANARGSSLVTDEWAALDAAMFCMYVGIFVLTVMTFRIGSQQGTRGGASSSSAQPPRSPLSKKEINLRFSYQLKQLSWTILTVGFVVVQMKCMVYTAHAGLIWAIFPASMIMMNDTAAYFSGVALGKRVCTKWKFFPVLSPKKTWEGFIGGGLCTLVYAFSATQIWGSVPLMRCSFPEVNAAKLAAAGTDVPWQDSLPMGACQNDHMFQVDPDSPLALLGLSRIQMVAVGLALFASTVAPFGGFAASATKRAFNIKDFDSLIPGHGGFTDRMDCQFLMGMAAWIAYTTFVRQPNPIVPLNRLIAAAGNLNVSEQRELLEALQVMVAEAGQ